MDARASLDGWGKENPCPHWESIPVVQPVASHTDWFT